MPHFLQLVKWKRQFQANRTQVRLFFAHGRGARWPPHDYLLLEAQVLRKIPSPHGQHRISRGKGSNCPHLVAKLPRSRGQRPAHRRVVAIAVESAKAARPRRAHKGRKPAGGIRKRVDHFRGWFEIRRRNARNSAVGVAVGLFVGVALTVAIWLGVAVAVTEGVGVIVGVSVGVAVGVIVGVALTVAVSLGVAVWVTEGVGVVVGVSVGVAELVAVGVSVGVVASLSG
jgi:hypothetical protein